MSKPSVLPEKRTFLQALLAEMPYHVSRDPLSKPVLLSSIYNPISSSDTAVLYISNGLCLIQSLSSYIPTEILILSNYTINDFMAYFNGRSAFRGIRMSYAPNTLWDDANVLASTLLEGVYTISSSSIVEIDKFTSTNYVLLQSLALSLYDEYVNMQSSLRQMDLRLASGSWLDYWGKLFSVSRSGFDYNNDSLYRARLQAETGGQKTNNVGLEDLLSSTLDRVVTVQDGGKPFTLSGTYNYAYGAATFSSGSSSIYLIPQSTSLFSAGQSVVASTSGFLSQVDSLTGALLSTTISSVAVTGGNTTGTYVLSRSALSSGSSNITASSIYTGNQTATSSYSSANITGTIGTSTISSATITGISTSAPINREWAFLNVISMTGDSLAIGDIVSFSSTNRFVIWAFGGNSSLGASGSGGTGVYSVKSITPTTSANVTTSAATATHLTTTAVSGNYIRIGQTITYYTSSSVYNTYAVTTGIASNKWGLIPVLTAQTGSGTSGSITGSAITDPNGINGYVTALTIGPNAGTGSFNVFIKLKTGETSLPYTVSSTATALVNKWKPAGIPFKIQTLQ